MLIPYSVVIISFRCYIKEAVFIPLRRTTLDNILTSKETKSLWRNIITLAQNLIINELSTIISFG
jgi:hypothetical protein